MNVLIHGISGAMGRQVVSLLEHEQLIGYDHTSHPTIKTYNDYDIEENIDVVIDFSHYSMIDNLLDYCLSSKTPLVLCTTGLEEATQSRIVEASKEIAVFQSGNMSLGINLLLKLAQIGAQHLNDFDIEIIERHHKKKIDAPSGTAFMIAEAIQSIKDLSLDFGRHGQNAKRKEQSIGVHAVRGGTITGDHTVLFAGEDETIELKHQATSKRVFAKGAIEAAYYLINKKSGLYNMNDLLGGIS